MVGGLLLDSVSFNLGLSGALNAVIGTGTAAGQLPVNRGMIAGLRLPTLELSFSFIEFTGGTSTENDDVVITLQSGRGPTQATLGRTNTSFEMTGGSLTDGTPGNSLVDATSLGALSGLREIPRY